MEEWEHSEMLYPSLPQVGHELCDLLSWVCYSGGPPPRGVILNVFRRPMLSHGFGTLPHQAEIWFITRCQQLSGA